MWDLSFPTRDRAHILSIWSMEFQPLDHQGATFFSRLTLCDPMDCSPPGSSVHGILQARVLLQGIFPTQGSNPSVTTLEADSLSSEPAEKPEKSSILFFPCLYSRLSGIGENPKKFFKWYQGEDSLNLIYWFLWSCLSSISYISLSQRIPFYILYLWRLPVIWLPVFPQLRNYICSMVTE